MSSRNFWLGGVCCFGAVTVQVHGPEPVHGKRSHRVAVLGVKLPVALSIRQQLVQVAPLPLDEHLRGGGRR